MSVRVIFKGWDELERKLGNHPRRGEIMVAAMEAQAGIVWSAVVPLTPVGVTSLLRGAWATQVLGGGAAGAGTVVGIVGNPLVYAEVIERGRRPGARMPPPDALRTWVARKMGPEASAFVVARSIGRKGIEAREMLKKAVVATFQVRRKLMGQIVAHLLERS